MAEVYVLCPAATVTGGPELLHQLVHTLRTNGRKAAIVYYPFGAREVPEAYRKYDIAVADIRDVTPDASLVVPEVYPFLIPRLPAAKLVFWWLSVDNHLMALDRYLRHSRLWRFLPSSLAARLWRRLFLGRVTLHLCQSAYAESYVQSLGMGPTAMLGDYLNEDFLAAIDRPPAGPRQDLIVYNPAKGREQTQRVLAAMRAQSGDRYAVKAIEKMTRDDVVALLARAKLYIDFGNHPGKDRIPREAAAMGMCVLVNRRGSACNAHDVPLPDAYKVDDRCLGFEAEAVAKMRAILDDFPAHSAAMDSYRAQIRGERAAFEADALRLFPK